MRTPRTVPSSRRTSSRPVWQAEQFSPTMSVGVSTGGTAYFIRNEKQLGEAYAQLEKDLRTQYFIAYRTESTKKDRGYRTVEVKVDRAGAVVRTIRGYIP